MPLSFSSICELLDQCYNLSLARKSCASIVVDWFDRHRSYVDAHDTSLSALLSTLLPDKRTDRVYCIQAPSLERIIGRACLLGASRIAELARYRQPGSGVDLADCVHRILTITPSPGYSQRGLVTVEEIDELLHSLASKVRWSSPSIRASQASMTPTNRTDVELMYRRLSAVEAKWFTRVQDDFATAITTTQTLRRRLLPNPGQQTPREQIMGTVKPQLGIKIGRQPWIKGRSIKHCLDMGHGSMSVEEKIDGEYCQIHIDPSKGDRCIQIFSKSGKDSTEDRVALHGTILESLKIGQPDARVTKGCILEGELVVYDDYLQELAKDATTAATLEDSQENLQWIAKLEAADPRGIAVDAASQLTMTTMPTPSPRKSTQNTTSTWSPTSPLTTRSPAGNIDSPCRDRVERFRPLILSTAVATLPTPAAPLDSFTRQRAKQKRDPLIIEPAPPHKRPKLDTESLPKDKHPLDSATSFQPRLPLTCVNDNSQSQPVMITCASPSTSVSLDDPDSDENDAPDSILCVNPEHSSPSGNDLETDAELHRDIPVNTIVSTGTKGCIYAGEDCAFAKTDVLISPGLLSNPTAKTLIELHGIENPVEHLDAWLEQEKSDKLRETGISSTMIFLLCQSDDKEATKSLFDKIQKVRESIPHRLQNWIHVYDWRVLQHVTIQEDATIQPKYYDGFHTPWQRWRIGTGLI
ncbi:hypothetical protein FPSE5266_02778 [Fusarium pseudograminearum]|nr:hypothetical protein FPSE5266_02778 [Fusarium pseudograminearum]